MRVTCTDFFWKTLLLAIDEMLQGSLIWDTAQHNTRTCSACQVAQLKYLTVCQFPKEVLGNLQVSTGVTLRENNLKEIEGGKILESEGVLVANKQALKRDSRLLTVVHELIERFEVRSS